jgi:broad specificity phosphatase PhoE
MKLIFVRHTTTAWNLEHRIQGQTDTELHEQGRTEAKKLAQELKLLKIDGIVSSGLKRSIQTAEIIAEKLGIPILKRDHRLNECSHGTLDGMTRPEMVARYGEDLLEKFPDRSGYDFTSLGGESRKQVLDREYSLLRDIVKEFVGKTILLIGHGRAMNTLLGELGKKDNLKRGKFLVVDFP